MRFKTGLLLLVLGLTACGAKKAYKDGVSLAATGQTVAASEKFLEALDRGYEEARPELEGVAEAAWGKRYAKAKAAEDSNDFEKARDEYKALARYQSRLERYDLLDFTRPVDPDAKAAEMSQGAAERDYAMAEQARVQQRFDSAIGYYRSSLGHVANYKDAAARIGQTYLEWGDAEVASGAYRQSVARYDAAAAEGLGVGKQRGAEVLSSLGHYHLDNGACRQAIRDFDAANSRAPAVEPDDVQWATACAERRVTIVLDPLSSREQRRYSGVDPVQRLELALTQRLPDAASPYLKLVSPDLLDGPARTQFGTPTVHRVIKGAILSGELYAMPVTSQQQSGTYSIDVPCVTDAGAAATCPEQRTYLYDLLSDKVAARLSVALRVSDGPTGRYQHGAWTFERQTIDEVVYAQNPRDSESGQALNRALLPVEVQALLDASREHKTDAELWKLAVDQLADDAAPWLAGIADAEQPAPDPTSLEIVRLDGVLYRPR